MVKSNFKINSNSNLLKLYLNNLFGGGLWCIMTAEPIHQKGNNLDVKLLMASLRSEQYPGVILGCNVVSRGVIQCNTQSYE